MNQLKGDQMKVIGEEIMSKNTSKKDTDIIAVHNGIFYEYHDESWHEKEFQSTNDKLEGDKLNVRYLYKDTTELDSIPKIVITPCESPRVTPGNEALMRRLMSIPFSKGESEVKDARKES